MQMRCTRFFTEWCLNGLGTHSARQWAEQSQALGMKNSVLGDVNLGILFSQRDGPRGAPKSPVTELSQLIPHEHKGLRRRPETRLPTDFYPTT